MSQLPWRDVVILSVWFFMFQEIANYANFKSIDNNPLWYFVMYSKHAPCTLIGLCRPTMAPLLGHLSLPPSIPPCPNPTHTPSTMHYNIDFSLLVLEIHKEAQILLCQPSTSNRLVNNPFSTPLSPTLSTLHLQSYTPIGRAHAHSTCHDSTLPRVLFDNFLSLSFNVVWCVWSIRPPVLSNNIVYSIAMGWRSCSCFHTSLWSWSKM